MLTLLGDGVPLYRSGSGAAEEDILMIHPLLTIRGAVPLAILAVTVLAGCGSSSSPDCTPAAAAAGICYLPASGSPGGGLSSLQDCTPDADPSACCPGGGVQIFTVGPDGVATFDRCVSETATLEDGNINSTLRSRSGEPNDQFVQAIPAALTGAAVANLQGAVERFGDLDVYSLGAMAAGDRIIIDLDSITGSLDPSMALFDSQAALFTDNDDEDFEHGNLDSYIDEIVRHDGDPYHLVVGHSAFAAFGSDTGNYVVNIVIERAHPVPPPVRQVFLLDFEGGDPGADNLLLDTVPAFDAAAIDETYAGQDKRIKAGIVATFLENFEEFDVVVATDPADLPPGELFSTVMLGGRSSIAFGISEAVDHYNADHGDRAVIFTESFTPARFTFTPTVEEIALAIGNIAAHEAGHLLGLNHVTDPSALMDGVSPADVFVSDQDFTIAPLSDDILPIGNQDAVQLLEEIIGLAGRRRGPVEPAVLEYERCTRSGHSGVWCATCGARVQ